MQAHKILIKKALSDGHTVSVWDGEEWAVKCSTKYREILGACDAVDAVCVLRIINKEGERIGSAWVYDEGLPESIIDHNDSPYMRDIDRHIDTFDIF